MILPSASKIELAHHCPFPFTAAIKWERRENAFGRYGSAVHKVAELAALGQAVDLPALAAQYELQGADAKNFELAAGHVVDFLAADRGIGRRAEVAFAYDVESGTVRELKKAHERDYSDRRRTEIPGTADLVQIMPCRTLLVRDWKTGHRALSKRPGHDPQMRFLGFAAARLWNAQEVAVELVHIDETGAYPDRADFDAWELDTIADELRALNTRLRAPCVPTPGSHCHDLYCPIVAQCPATVRAIEAIDRAAAPRFPMTGEFCDAEHVREVLIRLPLIRDACDAIEARAKEWAQRNGPVPMDGDMWGPVEHEGRERVEATPEAIEVVNRHLGDCAHKAIEYDVTKASLERGAKAVVAVRHDGQMPRGAVPKVLGPLLDDLRRVGALKKGAPYVRFERFKPALPAGGE